MVRGSYPGWGRDFPHPSRRVLGFTQPPITIGTGSFPRVKRPKRGVDRPPHLAPRLKKEQAIPPLPLWVAVACSTVKFTSLTVCREKWPFHLWLTGWIRIKIKNPDSVIYLVARLRVRVVRFSKLSISALGPPRLILSGYPGFQGRPVS